MASPGGGPGQVVPFPARGADQVGFERPELMRILDLYGRMVAAGEWRDYAMDFNRARVEKRPALRGKQGMWTLFGEHGQVLKRGHDLAGVLAPMERRLLKAVEE